MNPGPRVVVFSDVDTILRARSFRAPAARAMQFLAAEGIPLVFCSSATRAEIEAVQHELGLRDPFALGDGADGLHDDGRVPKDNPFVNRPGARPEIWSIGHRNIQAAALHPATGELWEVEHGTRGGDEVNIARKGKDYGWPTIAYGIEYRGGPITGGITQKAGMEQPIYYWDPVIAPSGMAFYTGALFPAWRGNLFVGALAGKHIARLVLDGRKVVGEERLLVDRGRIRDVRQGPDGALYALTDEENGELLRIVPDEGAAQSASR